jgi:hypothetical protein
VRERAEAAYLEKEIAYPVMAGLYHFTTRDPGGHKRYDREGLVQWARERFQVELDLEDLKNKQRDEIRSVLVEQAAIHGRFDGGTEAAAGSSGDSADRSPVWPRRAGEFAPTGGATCGTHSPKLVRLDPGL